MEFKSIIFVVIIILIVYIVASSLAGQSRLSEVADGKLKQTILAKDLPKAEVPNMNCTYSLWVYVKDWNYKYGQKKIVMGRSDEMRNQAPLVTLAATQNNLDIDMSVYSNTGRRPVKHTCTVTNIPLQKWVHVMLSIYNRTLDVYIDGKLARSCLLPGVPRLSRSENITITPDGGFSGSTAGFQFWDEESSPERAWNVYSSGYTGNAMGSLFAGIGTWSASLSISNNGVEQANLTL